MAVMGQVWYDNHKTRHGQGGNGAIQIPSGSGLGMPKPEPAPPIAIPLCHLIAKPKSNSKPKSAGNIAENRGGKQRLLNQNS